MSDYRENVSKIEPKFQLADEESASVRNREKINN